MIKKLRRKFIAISMCSVFAVLAAIMLVVNVINFRQISENSDRIIQILAENDGRFPRHEGKIPGGKQFESLPPDMSIETPYETRFFSARLNSAGEIISVNTGNIAAISTETAGEYAAEIFASRSESGYKDVYKYKSFSADDDEQTLVVFVDCSKELGAAKSFFITSVFVSLGGTAAVFVLVLLLSRIAVKPIAESYEKQKRFITDAGHEIKTPLTVIDANAEVLELEYGENEWTKSIKSQVERLSSLTANLISLSRLDEEKSSLQMLDFSMSDAVNETLSDFKLLAKSSEKVLSTSIDEGLTFTGDENAIRRLVSLLADNAIKYSPEHGRISVSLKKQGKQLLLTFTNDVESIESGNLNILFERFYRADSSRNSETGGYGIGLSVAKAIVTAHKGSITAESPDGKSIVITAAL